MVKGMNRLVLLGLALVLLVGLVVAGWHWQQHRVVQQAYEAGMAAADADRYEEALALALPYADRHDPQIDHLLGMIYINGPDGIKDINKGLTHRRAAADAGNMQAAYYLGKWLIEDGSSEAAVRDGLLYLQQAVECGMPMANYFLGLVLLEGKNAPLDLELGTKYSEFAAWAGIVPAQTNTFIGYSRIIENGDIIEENQINDRFYWLIIASENRDETAKRIIEESIQDSLNNGDLGIYDFLDTVQVEALRRSKSIQSPERYHCGFSTPNIYRSSATEDSPLSTALPAK